MKEIALQYIDGKFIPHSEKDRDTARSYKKHQIVKAKISGVQKPRSYRQLKLYWAIMRLVASNTDDPAWNEPEKVDFQCKVALRFYKKDRITVIGNQVLLELGSISFKELPHLEACNYFDRAFQVCADYLGVDVDVLKIEGEKRG